MTVSLTRDDLARIRGGLLSPPRNRTKADVRLVEHLGRRLVVKDYGPRGFIVRNLLGRFSIARECRAYARLRGLPGIPSFAGRIDPLALAYEFIPGTPLPGADRHSLPNDFFAALDRLLEAIHGRGMAVADLHHRNVIRRETDGGPALVDFALAVARPPAWNLPARWIFHRAVALDRIAARRIRLRYASPGGPDRVSPPAAPLPGMALYGAGRALKRVIGILKRIGRTRP